MKKKWPFFSDDFGVKELGHFINRFSQKTVHLYCVIGPCSQFSSGLYRQTYVGQLHSCTLGHCGIMVPMGRL